MSRSPLSLRAARASDAVVLASLWTDALRRGENADHVADCLAAIERAETSDTDRIVVAEYDGEVAGAVYLKVTTVSPINLDPIVHAISVQVFESRRRRGVGAALVESAVIFAEERGIAHVGVPVFAASRDANRFLARLALSPVATLRIGSTAAMRSRFNALRPSGSHPGRIDRVLAARRQRRRANVS
jgi:GNAT superfamily N-acetyltransferase